jgi:hypothetical protein
MKSYSHLLGPRFMNGPDWSRGIRPVIIHAPPFRLHLDFRLRPALRDFAETSRRDKAGFGFNSKGSATVPVAVGNVPLRTSSTPSVRRDADRRARDARAPHFTRELGQLHPDNPVNYTVTRGRNPPAATGLARPQSTFACWTGLLATAMTILRGAKRIRA